MNQDLGDGSDDIIFPDAMEEALAGLETVAKKRLAEALETPRTIRIGPFDWEVVDMSEVDQVRYTAIGRCRTTDLEIELAPELKPQRKAEVLLHEVLHAIFDTGDLREVDDQLEERIVNTIGMQLIQVIRDNPDLVRFIQGMAR